MAAWGKLMDLNCQGNAGAEAVAAVIMAKYDTDGDRGRELDAMLRSNDVVPAELATQLRAVQSVDEARSAANGAAGPPAEPAQSTATSSVDPHPHIGSEATTPSAGSEDGGTLPVHEEQSTLPASSIAGGAQLRCFPDNVAATSTRGTKRKSIGHFARGRR